MGNLKLELKDIKNIRKGVFEIPIEKGVYAITGTNGSGKSTIMNCLGKLVVDYSLYSLMHISHANEPQFSFSWDNKTDTFTLKEVEVMRKYKKKELRPHKINQWEESDGDRIRFNGLFEGSFFFGKRFKEAIDVDNYLDRNRNSLPVMLDADPFVGEHVSLILHNDRNHYKGLKHLGYHVATKYGFKKDPYFVSYDGNIVSQFSMSSGECLLISLFAFIDNVIGEEMSKSKEDETLTLLIIDEIEAALHPSAIKRLMEYFRHLAEEHNFMVILSSHSAEVIRQINPHRLFNIELSDDGVLQVSNPCYPSYAIRDVYTHIGYDVVILTEDELAKKYVNQTLNSLRLRDNRLINVLPVGGWENVIKLHKDLVNNGYFGPQTNVFCILDGDVLNIPVYKSDYRKDQSPKIFLPIPSVEKLLRVIVTDSSYKTLKNKLNSYVFNTDTIDQLYKDFYKDVKGFSIDDDTDGKKFYQYIIKHLRLKSISEDQFIDTLCSFVNDTTDSTTFKERLMAMLNV